MTDVFCHSDCPRLPSKTIAPIQRKYWLHIGWSRPSAASSCSRLFLSAPMSLVDSMRSMTSPGIIRTVTNTIRLAKIRVGIRASRRLMM